MYHNFQKNNHGSNAIEIELWECVAPEGIAMFPAHFDCRPEFQLRILDAKNVPGPAEPGEAEGEGGGETIARFVEDGAEMEAGALASGLNEMIIPR